MKVEFISSSRRTLQVPSEVSVDWMFVCVWVVRSTVCHSADLCCNLRPPADLWPLAPDKLFSSTLSTCSPVQPRVSRPGNTQYNIKSEPASAQTQRGGSGGNERMISSLTPWEPCARKTWMPPLTLKLRLRRCKYPAACLLHLMARRAWQCVVNLRSCSNECRMEDSPAGLFTALPLRHCDWRGWARLGPARPGPASGWGADVNTPFCTATFHFSPTNRSFNLVRRSQGLRLRWHAQFTPPPPCAQKTTMGLNRTQTQPALVLVAFILADTCGTWI